MLVSPPSVFLIWLRNRIIGNTTDSESAYCPLLLINSSASFRDVWFHLVDQYGACLVHLNFKFPHGKESPRSNTNSDIKKGTRQKEKLFCQAHERVTNSDYLSVFYRHQMHQCYMNALPTCLHVTNNVTKVYELEVTRVLAQKNVTKDPNTRTNCLATHKELQ